MAKEKRQTAGLSKVDVPMAPMIDITFQLLIFFMLNLKIVAPEGDFSINMPISPPAQSEKPPPPIPPIKVGLRSDANGNLTQLTIGGRSLGNDDLAFDRLNGEILKIIGRPNNPLTKEVEVEIDADYELHYRYVIQAISKCTGRLDPQTKQMIRYVEKIKFSPPKQPAA